MEKIALEPEPKTVRGWSRSQHFYMPGTGARNWGRTSKSEFQPHSPGLNHVSDRAQCFHDSESTSHGDSVHDSQVPGLLAVVGARFTCCCGLARNGLCCLQECLLAMKMALTISHRVSTVQKFLRAQ